MTNPFYFSNKELNGLLHEDVIISGFPDDQFFAKSTPQKYATKVKSVKAAIKNINKVPPPPPSF